FHKLHARFKACNSLFHLISSGHLRQASMKIKPERLESGLSALRGPLRVSPADGRGNRANVYRHSNFLLHSASVAWKLASESSDFTLEIDAISFIGNVTTETSYNFNSCKCRIPF